MATSRPKSNRVNCKAQASFKHGHNNDGAVMVPSSKFKVCDGYILSVKGSNAPQESKISVERDTPV